MTEPSCQDILQSRASAPVMASHRLGSQMKKHVYSPLVDESRRSLARDVRGRASR